jgi:hypothetical protein
VVERTCRGASLSHKAGAQHEGQAYQLGAFGRIFQSE